jgi:hypothetical protein
MEYGDEEIDEKREEVDMIYFDDLLTDANIDDTISRIAGDFRKKHNFRRCVSWALSYRMWR